MAYGYGMGSRQQGGMTSTGSQHGPYSSGPIWGGYKPAGQTQSPYMQRQQGQFGQPNQRGDTIPVFNQGQGQTAAGHPINSFGGGAPRPAAQPMNPSMMLGAQPYASSTPMYGASQGYMNQQAPASTGGAYVGGMGGGQNNPSNYEYNAATDPGTAYKRTAGYAKNQADQGAFAQQQAAVNNPMQFQQQLQSAENARVTAEQPQLAANNAAADAASRAQYASQLQTVNPEFAGQASPFGANDSLASIYKPSMAQQMAANPTDLQRYTQNRGSGMVGGFQKPPVFAHAAPSPQLPQNPLLQALMGQ